MSYQASVHSCTIEWCQNPSAGVDHFCLTDTPASADGRGKVVGVHLSYAPPEYPCPEVGVYIQGPNGDSEAFMVPDEAIAFRGMLDIAIDRALALRR